MNDNETILAAQKAALIALSNFRNRQDSLAVLNDFGGLMAKQETSLQESCSDPDVAEVGGRLWRVERDYFFLYRVSELKIGYLAQALEDAIKGQNPLALASTTRALVEHLAALLFQMEKAEKLLDRLKGQNSKQKIDRLLLEAEKTIKRCYFGISPKVKAVEVKQFHVEEFLETFASRVTDIREVYDCLCEYVHPNYGSNLLVSTGQLGGGRLAPPIEVHAEIIKRICHYCVLFMSELDKIVWDYAQIFARFSKLVEIALQPQTTLGSLFAERGLKTIGDGKSRETAIYFPRARNAMEAVEMIYRYLREQDMEMVGPKQIGAIEGGFIYDVFPTDKGQLWFKTTMVNVSAENESNGCN